MRGKEMPMLAVKLITASCALPEDIEVINVIMTLDNRISILVYGGEKTMRDLAKEFGAEVTSCESEKESEIVTHYYMTHNGIEYTANETRRKDTSHVPL